MNVKSNKVGSFKFPQLKWNESVYLRFGTYASIIAIIIGFLPFSWGVSIAITVVTGIILTFVLNGMLGYYNNFYWSKYFFISALFLLLTSPGTWLPMVNDYKYVERIDETLTLDKEVKVYYNDYHHAFFLFIDGVKQPMAIAKDQSETYNRLKADFLDNKIKVERKRVKAWYEDEVNDGYFLDGTMFR